MKKILQAGLAIGLVSLCMTSSSVAGSLTVTSNNGTTNVTTALTGFQTYGDMMDGMSVTAYFAGGGSETRSWTDTGSGAGGVTGTGWTLAESGDTYGGYWTLTATSAIASIFIDAGTGDTVFDRTFSPYPGTSGSANGWDFSIVGVNNWDITATYRDVVALQGSDPVGDLFRTLTISFGSGSFGPGADTLAVGAASAMLTFVADTDNLSISGDIRPEPVPEPTTMLLFGSGLVGLAAVGRRKRI